MDQRCPERPSVAMFAKSTDVNVLEEADVMSGEVNANVTIHRFP